MSRSNSKLFDRRLATKADYERWQSHEKLYEPGMIVKVVRRRAPVRLITRAYFAGRLGVWFEAQSILGGLPFYCATDQFKFVLCEMEALAWCAKEG